ncbi:hypothetical protein EMIHUDRAFT_199638 [Emiliania huxleyi CCMP1516]|uniref:Uncharacterized protein n=2 Tax=Emiliania huxleyi TaxID=2903 RepID=A0A0D3KZY8_EMIH1|nr:hypothetical protein EMIHUDRAFT_199638 [Emiliania huxleyi CCMP1516]EOD41323.1 hypothetical protein EMIHUDRAFT_199638 [Emiliania huxleyi CCMP1516]|eukprot:XP_005793752.1 hypothetical protein EMIHUDRAFT_199638 [Emiliania huxleyi CCMP1516]
MSDLRRTKSRAVVVLFAMSGADASASHTKLCSTTLAASAAAAATTCSHDVSRRGVLHTATALASGIVPSAAHADGDEERQKYFLRFPTLFAPLYGESSRRTIKRQLGDRIWALEQQTSALEQNLELGPLETPLRCVVVRLQDGSLWVHAPLAPSREFFELVESCAEECGAPSPGPSPSSAVRHIVVPTYALEHKVFAKDALLRWSDAQLWLSPGQFSFPRRSVSDEFVWGRRPSGVLSLSDEDAGAPAVPWAMELPYQTLAAGTFSIGGTPTTFYETAFFHRASRSLIVTDALARVPIEAPPLSDPARLLLAGWEKTALLVSFFFPEHEEADPAAGLGVVTWTEGWHDNFRALAGRLLVPPVVRTLLYAQDPAAVRRWVDAVARRWQFEQIVPAHFEAPIRASPSEFARAFAFLEDERIDAFPAGDTARGLRPIARIASSALRASEE